jgi:hypothetical protein
MYFEGQGSEGKGLEMNQDELRDLASRIGIIERVGYDGQTQWELSIKFLDSGIATHQRLMGGVADAKTIYDIIIAIDENFRGAGDKLHWPIENIDAEEENMICLLQFLKEQRENGLIKERLTEEEISALFNLLESYRLTTSSEAGMK